MNSMAFAFILFSLIGAGLSGETSAVGPQRMDRPEPTAVTPMIVGEAWRIRSLRLGEDCDIRVYLPPSYAGTQARFPVIYALDGEGLGPIAASAVQFMSGYPTIPRMPEAIVVGIPSSNRNRDMPIPAEYGRGGEDAFLAFLADDLIPAVERRYRTQPFRVLVGHSQGGLFAVYAMTARPDAFQWYLSLDAPLSGFPEIKWLMDKAANLISRPSVRKGRLVSIENLYGWKQDWPSPVEASPSDFFREQLTLKDETHETMAYEGVYEGFKRLFHDYASFLVRDAKVSFSLTELEARYRALSEAYGYPVEIPRPVLLMSASRKTALQQGREAVDLIERAMALYGETPATKSALTEARAATAKGTDSRLETWAALAPPSAEQMKPFLGTWRRAAKEGARWLVIFEVVNGTGRVRNSVTPPSGEAFQLEVAFVQILEDKTVRWGERNGKGPGVMVLTVRLTDENTLEGTMEAIGFIGPPPAGKVVYKREL